MGKWNRLFGLMYHRRGKNRRNLSTKKQIEREKIGTEKRLLSTRLYFSLQRKVNAYEVADIGVGKRKTNGKAKSVD